MGTEQEEVVRTFLRHAHGPQQSADAMTEITAAITPQQPAEHAVVVFNQLGFARSGLVEISGATAGLPPGAIQQPSADGGTLFLAHVPSLGYATADTAANTLADDQRATVSVSVDGETVVLENATLRATITRVPGWELTSVVDKQSGAETIAGGAANAFRVYKDDGGLYRFGSEMAGCSLTAEADGGDAAVGDAMVLESGPLRVRVQTQVVMQGAMYQKEYSLVAGEPFLRMRSTGSAPPGTSVLVGFPVAGAVDAITFGTPYHWDRKLPARAGNPTFEAVHDFLIPSFEGVPQGALFHAGVPAWAIGPDGVLAAALWRDAPQEHCDLYGASGTDAGVHTVDYAWRVPSGIQPPEQAQQLRESLAFQVPLQAISGTLGGTLPREFSLAAASPDTAIITAAKEGTADPDVLILRVYQPTNAALAVTVRSAAQRRVPADWSLDVHGETALETPLPAAREATLAVSGSADEFSFTAVRALTTIAVGRRP